jgi:protein translocase SecG subunit
LDFDTIKPIMSIAGMIPYVQIILSILLIGGVLLQQSDAGLGSGFGGGDGFSSGHHTKRGAEKIVFVGTIVVSILFAVTSFSLLLI